MEEKINQRSTGLEYTTNDTTDEELEMFRKGVDELMEKYKVFHISYSINPFKKAKGIKAETN